MRTICYVGLAVTATALAVCLPSHDVALMEDPGSEGGSTAKAASCDGDRIVVDSQDTARGFARVEDALACLSRRRLNRPVELVIASGTYSPFEDRQTRETRMLVIDHPDASNLTIRGESRLEVELRGFASYAAARVDGKTSHYRFKYVLKHRDWLKVVNKLRSLEAGAEAYASVRRTRPFSSSKGANHLLHQGFWRIDIPATVKTRDRVILEIVYQPRDHEGNAALPSPLNAHFSTKTPPIATILTSVLEFRCSGGLLVDSTTLGEVRDLAIVGDYSSVGAPPRCSREKRRRSVQAADRKWSENFPGIEVRRGGGLTLGRYVGVSSMDGQGVSSLSNSWVLADRTAASGNERRGFYSMLTAAMELRETVAAGNQTDGYVADHSAYMELRSALAVGNREHGVNSLFGADVKVVDGIAFRNALSGFISKAGGTLWIAGQAGRSHALHNGSPGLYSELGGHVLAKNLVLWGNDQAKANVGILFEAGSVYTLESTVDNQDGEVLRGKAARANIDEPQPRRFFQNRRHPPLAKDGRTFQATEIVIDPEYSGRGPGARSLHEFFNEDKAFSVFGKRIVVQQPLSEGQPGSHVDVKLRKGIHVHRGGPVVILHPDAKRIRIRGEACAIRIQSSMRPVVDCGASCLEVKLQLRPHSCEDPIVVGDLIAIMASGTNAPGYSHAAVHEGLWQVTATGVNEDVNRIKVRNLGGKAYRAADNPAKFHLAARSYPARVLRSVLYFPEDPGGLIVDGTALGELRDVAIVGPEFRPVTAASAWKQLEGRTTRIDRVPKADTRHCKALGYNASRGAESNRTGLVVQNCGHLLFNQVAVTGFGGGGIRVIGNSSVHGWSSDGFLPGSLIATGNLGDGIASVDDAEISAKNSISSANSGSGFVAKNGGVLYVALSTAATNRKFGFVATDGGYLEVGGSAAIRNDLNGIHIKDSRLSASRGIAAVGVRRATVCGENAHHGYKVEGSSYAALDGAWSVGHRGTNRAGVHLAGGSFVRARGMTLVGNTYSLKAMSESFAFAGRSLCVGNDHPWYVQSAVVNGACEYCETGQWNLVDGLYRCRRP